jgi:hypothetical protein
VFLIAASSRMAAAIMLNLPPTAAHAPYCGQSGDFQGMAPWKFARKTRLLVMYQVVVRRTAYNLASKVVLSPSESVPCTPHRFTDSVLILADTSCCSSESPSPPTGCVTTAAASCIAHLLSRLSPSIVTSKARRWSSPRALHTFVPTYTKTRTHSEECLLALLPLGQLFL